MTPTNWAPLAAMAVIVACASPGAQPPPTLHPLPAAELAREVDPIVEAGMREFKFPGISLVIMRGHTVLLSKGYGMANRETGTPATDSTVYSVGSLSKQMTAAAIMTLVEKGRVHLDDPLSKYLPELAIARDSDLRIRTLLRQASGLPAWDDLPELQGLGFGPDSTRFTFARIVSLIGEHPPLFKPGSWWSYSNSNYTLLAAVIERVTGVTYDDYLTQTLFRPLGMRATRSCTRLARPGELPRAVGYEAVGDSLAVRRTRAYLQPGMTGAGGLCSSAVELAAWMRALVDGRAVSPESYRQMTTASPVGAGFTPPYGFGVSLLPLVGQPAVWHVGVMEGFMSVLAYLPEQDIVLAAVGNSRRALLNAIVKRVMRRMLGTPAPALLDLPVSSAEANRSAGTYDDAMFRFRIIADSGRLYADVPDLGIRERLLYQGDHKFIVAGPSELRFRFDPSGTRAQIVAWEWSELRAFGKRVQ